MPYKTPSPTQWGFVPTFFVMCGCIVMFMVVGYGIAEFHGK